MYAEPHGLQHGRFRRPRRFALGVLVAALAAAGCASGPPPAPIRVASTTSIVDTGLADALAERYLSETRIRMRIQAVGSGEAFRLGRAGEADLVLAHDPEAFDAFRREGFVAESRAFARNDFVLAGPAVDSAGVASSADLVDAFRRIAAARATFVSRGDRSGTFARERQVWTAAGLQPDAEVWYRKTGQGMAETLNVAGELGGYVLTDSATFATVRSRDRLRALVDRGPMRDNVYVAIVVRYGGAASASARRFLDFLAVPETRRFVTEFGRPRTGRPLFRAP